MKRKRKMITKDIPVDYRPPEGYFEIDGQWYKTVEIAGPVFTRSLGFPKAPILHEAPECFVTTHHIMIKAMQLYHEKLWDIHRSIQSSYHTSDPSRPATDDMNRSK